MWRAYAIGLVFALLPGAARLQTPLYEPPQNLDTSAKVRLGEALFHDTRLSVTGQHSCASCHQPERHFTDGLAVAIGATGARHHLNTPTLYNVGLFVSLGWEPDGTSSLETQHLIPLTNTNPVELGFEPHMLAVLAADTEYAALHEQAFGDARFTLDTLTAAIASFVRTLRHPQTAFDRYLFDGEHQAMSDQALTGMHLFASERLGCAGCHRHFTLSGPIVTDGVHPPAVFHHTGVGGTLSRFRAPSLRAVQHTAPYMHAGQLATLEDVLDHYEHTEAGEVPDFSLTPDERQALLAFLKSL